jgi:molybdopterin/thiamine biosynthesis adenylyltransferase
MANQQSELGRDARHVALQQIGAEGQARIAASSALLIGAGGIGCAASQYLVSSGIGRIVICDFDSIDATNLGRQVLYGPGDIGKPKVSVAADRLAAANPDVDITIIDSRLEGDALVDMVSGVDVVLDGSDNFATRFQLSDACVDASRCLVSGAAIRLEGQLAVFGPDYDDTPCYRCLYTEADESLENCAGNGVLAPVPGVIGALMAVETLKQLAGLDVERGRLLLFDASSGDFRSIGIPKRGDCPACG